MQPHNFPVQKMSPFIVQGQQYLRFSNWLFCKAFLYLGTKYFDTNNLDTKDFGTYNFGTNDFGTNDFVIEKA